MNLPSLNHIVSKSSASIKRFPLVIASGTVAAFASIYLSEIDYDLASQAAPWYSLIMVSILGISLFFAIKLTGERRGWGGAAQTGANLFGIGLLIAYYFLLPDDFDTAPEAFIFRYLLYLLAAHLLVAVGPYFSQSSHSGFWQYNKTLFLRFLTAVLFSGVLYVGLTVALGSIDVLLDVEIKGERYFQLFVLVGGIFNTWFFVSGIPDPVTLLDSGQDYPKGLKIFTQNILIPLVTIYVVILYLYTGKIILAWSWPEGWVAYLVLSFSIVGIFALLLLHPIQDRVENRWIKKFSRSYFWTLVPLVILLLLAIWRRIWEYSFTVNRYFVLTLGIWLAGIVLYFILSKAKNIKVIPASLGIIAVMISFGPWGAFSVSENSQKQRLEQYLVENKILAGDTIQKTDEPVSFEDSKEISSIVRYLVSMHGTAALQPWFTEDLSSLTKQAVNADTLQPVPRYEMPRHLTQMMGVDYLEEWQDSTDVKPLRTFSSEEKGVTAINSYDWMVNYQYAQSAEEDKSVFLGNDSLSIRLVPEQASLLLFSPRVERDTLHIDLNPMIQYLQDNYSISNTHNISSSFMMAEGSNDWLRIALYLNSITIEPGTDNVTITDLNGRLLIRKEEDR